MEKRSFIVYYRVSSKKQEASGLGIEAQKAAVAEYLARYGGEVQGEFEERESGRKDDRPKLAEAVRECRSSDATLLVSKLDRLARSVYLIACLKREGIKFVVADMPDANNLTINLLAAVAEHEAEIIRARTSAALKARRERIKRGEVTTTKNWGTNSPEAIARYSALGTANSAIVRHDTAAKHVADILPTVQAYRKAGDSLREIAAKLNTKRILTPYDKTRRLRGEELEERSLWNAKQVQRVLATAS